MTYFYPHLKHLLCRKPCLTGKVWQWTAWTTLTPASQSVVPGPENYTIEFKSDGKAFVSTGPITTTCSYSESGKALTLDCEGDRTEFTIEDDGALSGPPDGMLARLTRQQ